MLECPGAQFSFLLYSLSLKFHPISCWQCPNFKYQPGLFPLTPLKLLFKISNLMCPKVNSCSPPWSSCIFLISAQWHLHPSSCISQNSWGHPSLLSFSYTSIKYATHPIGSHLKIYPELLLCPCYPNQNCYPNLLSYSCPWLPRFILYPVTRVVLWKQARSYHSFAYNPLQGCPTFWGLWATLEEEVSSFTH